MMRMIIDKKKNDKGSVLLAMYMYKLTLMCLRVRCEFSNQVYPNRTTVN